MPNPIQITDTYRSALAATFAHRSKGYVDQISQRLALFWWLKRKGQYKSVGGGHRIEWPVFYELDTDDPSYSGLDTWTLQEQDPYTIAFANWKHYEEPIVLPGIDVDVINAGERIFDLAKALEDQALSSIQHQMNDHMYADGTGNSSKRITGLDASLSEDPTTGTVYGINRATETWWRSQIQDDGSGTSAVPAYASTEYTMRKGMNALYTKCGRGKGGKSRYPDLGLCSEVYLEAYDDMCNAIGQRFVNQDTADAGFQNLMFRGTTIIQDEDAPTDQTNTSTTTAAGPAQKCYFINSEFVEMAYAPRRNFRTRGKQDVINQDAIVDHILWSGNLCVKQPRRCGVHIGIGMPT